MTCGSCSWERKRLQMINLLCNTNVFPVQVQYTYVHTVTRTSVEILLPLKFRNISSFDNITIATFLSLDRYKQYSISRSRKDGNNIKTITYQNMYYHLELEKHIEKSEKYWMWDTVLFHYQRFVTRIDT